MNAPELLSRCRNYGIDLEVGPDGALHWEADIDPPAELLATLAEHKGSLLTLLSASSAKWDAAAADAELRLALVAITVALSSSWLTAAQRNFLTVFRRQVSDYHARSDPFLFGAAAWIEAHVARWRSTLGREDREREQDWMP